MVDDLPRHLRLHAQRIEATAATGADGAACHGKAGRPTCESARRRARWASRQLPAAAPPGSPAGGAPAPVSSAAQPAAAPQASLQAVGQSAAQTSPNAVGLADAPQDQPSLALDASLLDRSAPARLATGALVVASMAVATACLVLGDPRRRDHNVQLNRCNVENRLP